MRVVLEPHLSPLSARTTTASGTPKPSLRPARLLDTSTSSLSPAALQAEESGHNSVPVNIPRWNAR
jgi:hypothetical protein